MHPIIQGIRQFLALPIVALIWALEALGAVLIAVGILTLGIMVALIVALSWLKNGIYHEA